MVTTETSSRRKEEWGKKLVTEYMELVSKSSQLYMTFWTSLPGSIAERRTV